MNPQDVEALAQEIVAAAALIEGEDGREESEPSEALEAALAVESVLRELTGEARVLGPSADAETGLHADDDKAWFDARPTRTARLRPHRSTDARPSWAQDGQVLMTAVRRMHALDRCSPSVVSADALSGEPIADTDEAVLAAFRAANGLHY